MLDIKNDTIWTSDTLLRVPKSVDYNTKISLTPIYAIKCFDSGKNLAEIKYKISFENKELLYYLKFMAKNKNEIFFELYDDNDKLFSSTVNIKDEEIFKKNRSIVTSVIEGLICLELY